MDYDDAIKKWQLIFLKYALEINYNNCRNITPSSENEINKLYEYDDLVKKLKLMSINVEIIVVKKMLKKMSFFVIIFK
ncbi:MAG: hypothetical protein L6U99_12005 [Clostridium sp.]|nr:MAG: hypothetical protein L6U99_12005 [Clostridium sp.]